MRRLAFCASLAVTILGGGCTDSGPKSPVSAYALTTVGAKPLPVMMFEEVGYTLQVIGGTAELTADGKYTLSLTVKETVDGKESTYIDRESGAWTILDYKVTLTPTEGDPHEATWERTTLTMTLVEVVFVFTMS